MLKISRILRSFSKLEQRLPKQQPIRKKKGVSARRISLLGMTAFLTYMIYHHRRQSQFEFLMHNSQINRQIIQNNKQLNQEQYKPSIYFAFSFLEMLYAHYIEAKKEIRIDKQEVVEGCSIDYMAKSARDQNRDINSNTSIYAGCVIVVAGSEGLNELMANIMLLSTSNHYEAIGISVDDPFDTAKLTRIISRIKQQRKGKNFYGVGIEYGANLLVLAAANNPDLFNCIVSIGNPLDLIQAQTKVQNSKIAQLTFLGDMIKGRIRKSKENIPHNTPLPQLTKLIYNIPTQDQVLKFKHTNSSINHISKLKTPALFLNSKQDPFSMQ